MIANVSTFLTLALVTSFVAARPTPVISGEADVEARSFKTFAEDAGHDAEKALGVGKLSEAYFHSSDLNIHQLQLVLSPESSSRF